MHLLNTYCVQWTVLGTKDTMATKTVSAITELIVQWEPRQETSKYAISISCMQAGGEDTGRTWGQI